METFDMILFIVMMTAIAVLRDSPLERSGPFLSRVAMSIFLIVFLPLTAQSQAVTVTHSTTMPHTPLCGKGSDPRFRDGMTKSVTVRKRRMAVK